MGDPTRSDGPQRGTVGVYDRPASADRRERWLKATVWIVAVAAAVGGWWWAGAPGLGG
jgi:multidrug resistance efflux pump